MKMKGRLIFTCAHEVGHWCLHRRYVDIAGRTSEEEGVVLCRTDKTQKLPVEWQADYFAGCLLMPEEMLEVHGVGHLNLREALWRYAM